mgnify:CR=1 FL=1
MSFMTDPAPYAQRRARLLEQMRGRYLTITESEADRYADGVVGYSTANDDAGFGPAGMNTLSPT